MGSALDKQSSSMYYHSRRDTDEFDKTFSKEYHNPKELKARVSFEVDRNQYKYSVGSSNSTTARGGRRESNFSTNSEPGYISHRRSHRKRSTSKGH